MVKRYQLSGNASAASIAICATYGIVTGAVFGAIYDYMAVFIPFVYISVAFTVALGIALGYSVYRGALRGHVRNSGAVAAIALVAGVVSLYSAWAVHGRATSELLESEEKLPIMLNPVDILSFAGLITKHGTWGFNGTAVNGGALILVWTIEVIIILLVARHIGPKFLKRHIYCESCNRWNPTAKTLFRFGGPNAWEAVQQFARENLDGLRSTQVVSKGAGGAIRVDMSRCSTCEDTSIVSLIQENKVVNDDGKIKTEEVPVVDKLVVSAAVVEQLVNASKRADPD